MSSKKELSEDLASAIRSYGADYGFVVTDKAVKKLLGGSVREAFEVEGCTPKGLAEALMGVGKVIRQSDDETEYVAVIGAGIANMNIAMTVARIDGSSIEMIAAANEGLIKQSTAKRAIDRVKDCLLDGQFF